MSNTYIYTSIFLIALVTYLIRVIPLLVLRKPIKSRFFRSFLFYAPYVTLAVLTFPAILGATGSFASAFAGFLVAVVCALLNLGLPITAGAGCIAALILELIL
ncbi:MAG: AzlD domain-containing protein [Spirochaetales bacterium]|nr:AzlD domain-containing protein [Candidatus Physcosoma equi]